MGEFVECPHIRNFFGNSVSGGFQNLDVNFVVIVKSCIFALK